MTDKEIKEELERIDKQIENGPFKNNWESLSKITIPKWYEDACLGIFIHFSVCSQTAYANEWYPRNMYIQGTREYEHHIKTYGPHKEFGLKDFIPQFKAEKFDAKEWIDLFKESGASYVVPVAEHHDGFQMYESKISKWNAKEMGPKKDIVKELVDMTRKEGLVAGTSSHRIEHFWFLSHGKEFDSDIKEPLSRDDMYWPSMKEPEDQFDPFSIPTPDKEFLDDWLIRTVEIIDKFSPSILYFDWWIHHASAKEHVKKMMAYYYNHMYSIGKEGVINYKYGSIPFGCGVVDVERGQFAYAKPYIWQTDTSIGDNSWGYVPDNVYKSADRILEDLCDIVSKNGRLLLNVGPKGNGEICEEEKEVLKKIGRWMKINSKALEGAKPFEISSEGPTKISDGYFTEKATEYTSKDFRFTSKDGKLYIIAMKKSTDSKYIVKSLARARDGSANHFLGIIKDIKELGGSALTWKHEKDGLYIDFKSEESGPVVFEVTFV